MREAEIRAQQASAVNRDKILFDQMNFLNMRMTALETVLKVSTVWNRIKWAFNPLAFLAVVDAVQLQIHRESQEAAKKRATAPKLTVVGATGAKEVTLNGSRANV
jgi:hypothetical protein